MNAEYFKKGAQAFDRAYTRRDIAVKTIQMVERTAAEKIGASLHEYYLNHEIVTFTHSEKMIIDEQYKIIRNANRTMDSKLNDKQNYEWHTKRENQKIA